MTIKKYIDIGMHNAYFVRICMESKGTLWLLYIWNGYTYNIKCHHSTKAVETHEENTYIQYFHIKLLNIFYMIKTFQNIVNFI